MSMSTRYQVPGAECQKKRIALRALKEATALRENAVSRRHQIKNAPGVSPDAYCLLAGRLPLTASYPTVIVPAAESNVTASVGSGPIGALATLGPRMTDPSAAKIDP